MGVFSYIYHFSNILYRHFFGRALRKSFNLVLSINIKFLLGALSLAKKLVARQSKFSQIDF
jgi:hypothetical protein